MTDARHTDEMFQKRLSLFYSAIFLSVGFYLPYFPLWLSYKGLDPQKVGIILAAPMIIRIVFAPLISIWADQLGDYRFILIILGTGSFVALLLFLGVDDFYALLLIAGFNAIFGSALIPLTETFALAGQRDHDLNYGQARAWGSASFVVANLAGGEIIDRFGPSSILYLLILSGLFIVVSALLLPRPQGKGRLRAAVAKGRFSRTEIKALLSRSIFWLFLLAAGLTMASHAFYYGFSALHWATKGMSSWTIGCLWALGVIAEILLFVFFGNKLRQFNPAKLMLIGALIGVVRWGGMATDPGLGGLVVLQTLHAFSFGLVHLGAMYFISTAVSEKRAATAQGMLATTGAGVFMGAMVLISGPLYEWGQSWGYFVMAFVTLIACGFSLILYQLWDGCDLDKTQAKAAKLT